MFGAGEFLSLTYMGDADNFFSNVWVIINDFHTQSKLLHLQNGTNKLKINQNIKQFNLFYSTLFESSKKVVPSFQRQFQIRK